MEKVNSKDTTRFIKQAIENGESDDIAITDEADRKYLRVLLSNYNTKNKTRLSARKYSENTMRIIAPFTSRQTIHEEKKTNYCPLFVELQPILDNPDIQLTEEEFNLYSKRVSEVLKIIQSRGYKAPEAIKPKKNNILG